MKTTMLGLGTMLFAALATPLPKTAAEWVQLALVGEWRGYSRPGAPNGFAITERDLHDMVRTFNANPRGRVVCDYEHQTLRSVDNGKPAPAAGWFTALEVRPGEAGRAELWGRAKWTPSADTAISNEEYAYLSPVIVWRHRNKVTGKEEGTFLHSVALTNSPFLDELPAIAATDLETPSMLMHLIALCAMPADSTEEDVVARVEELANGKTAACTALGLAPTATPAEIQGRFTELSHQAKVGEFVLKESKVALGDKPETAIALLTPVLQHAGMIAASDHVRVVDELAGLKAVALVAAARDAGKIVPTNEAWALALAKSAPAQFTAWCNVAPVVVGAADRTRRGPPATAAALSDVELAVMRQIGVDDKTYRAARALET